ncbi:MAG: hypothetical protein HWE24_06320 [Oceanospirillaceae bacterium]|nr:hypothetical protein [Oceanospirillaceae bacterium]
MSKNDKIINVVYNTIGIKLNKSQLNSSTINKTGLYSVEPNYKRKEKDWHLVLINTRIKRMYVFVVPSNHAVYKKLYIRADKNVYRLLFNVDDNSFREIMKYERFDKFLVGECQYYDDLF